MTELINGILVGLLLAFVILVIIICFLSNSIEKQNKKEELYDEQIKELDEVKENLNRAENELNLHKRQIKELEWLLSVSKQDLFIQKIDNKRLIKLLGNNDQVNENNLRKVNLNINVEGFDEIEDKINEIKKSVEELNEIELKIKVGK